MRPRVVLVRPGGQAWRVVLACVARWSSLAAQDVGYEEAQGAVLVKELKHRSELGLNVVLTTRREQDPIPSIRAAPSRSNPVVSCGSATQWSMDTAAGQCDAVGRATVRRSGVQWPAGRATTPARVPPLCLHAACRPCRAGSRPNRPPSGCV